jgi:membrane associated rhomboid family serine protease
MDPRLSLGPPPLTIALVGSNVLVFALSGLAGGALVADAALWPVGSGFFAPWQLFTYAFVHTEFTHLAFNMLGLWMFGAPLERLWGARRFVLFYAASLLMAGATQLVLNAALGNEAPTIGASGGLFGLLLGFAVEFPHARIVPLIPPIPMPARVAVTLYGLIELVLGVTGTASGVAHFAHLGGLLGGALVLLAWHAGRPRL